MNGDAFIASLVAVALANRLLLAPLPRALPPLRTIALHGVVSALVATAAIVFATAVQALLEPLALRYPQAFLALPLSALLTVLAAVLLPRWRAALRDADWRLVGANAVILVFIAGTKADAAAIVVQRAFATAALFALALVALCALEQRLQPAQVPKAFRGLPIALLNAGLLALAGQGLAGLLPA